MSSYLPIKKTEAKAGKLFILISSEESENIEKKFRGLKEELVSHNLIPSFIEKNGKKIIKIEKKTKKDKQPTFQGIKIECKKPFGQIAVRKQPYCILNKIEEKSLQWKKDVFIPLQPEKPYQITVKYPYMGRDCGVATFNTQVKEGEIKHFLYKAPIVVTSSGKIRRKK